MPENNLHLFMSTCFSFPISVEFSLVCMTLTITCTSRNELFCFAKQHDALAQKPKINFMKLYLPAVIMAFENPFFWSETMLVLYSQLLVYLGCHLINSFLWKSKDLVFWNIYKKLEKVSLCLYKRQTMFQSTRFSPSSLYLF